MYVLTFFLHDSSLLCSIQRHLSYPLLLHSLASVMSNSVRPRGLSSTRSLCPWDSLGKNTGVGCHFPFQFPFLGHNSFLLYFLWEDFFQSEYYLKLDWCSFFFSLSVQMSSWANTVCWKDLPFPPLNCSETFCHDLTDYCVWIYLCILSSVQLINTSIFLPMENCLD